MQDTIPDKKNVPLMNQAALQVLVNGLYALAAVDAVALKKAADFVSKFIGDDEKAYARFAEFCQRILMVRHYIITHPKFQFAYPLHRWLDPANKHGFAGSAQWFADLQEKRKLRPMHMIKLKAFPEAILELAEERSPEIYNYWFPWFLENDATDEAILFKLTASSIAFGESNTLPDLPNFRPLPAG